MNKKLAVIGIAVLAAVAIIAVLIWRFPNGIGILSVQNPPVTSNQLPQETQSIIQAGDASKCASVNSVVGGVNYETVCKNNIAWNAAQTNLDITVCNALDDKLMLIADCQHAIVGKLAAKSGSLTTCDQFTGDLKTSCINDHWLSLAVTGHDPAQCLQIGFAGSPADLGCQNSVLLSSLSTGTSTPQCSLFTGTVKTDCTNYNSGNCQALTLPQLQRFCLQKGK